MGNWGDDKDTEVTGHKDPTGRFTVNFKKMITDVDRIVNETVEVNDRHPKFDLLKEWAGTQAAFFVLFLFSYQILCFITLIFMAFYGYCIIKIGKAWKHFNYKMGTYILTNICTLAIVITVALTIQHIIMK